MPRREVGRLTMSEQTIETAPPTPMAAMKSTLMRDTEAIEQIRITADAKTAEPAPRTMRPTAT